MKRKYKKQSIVNDLLLSLLPYTKQNMLLTYKPGAFFDNVSEKTGVSRTTLQSSLSRAIKNGYVERDGGVPILTKKGMTRIEKVPNGLPMADGNYFLVVYDIPQKHDYQRKLFATELKALGFEQYQKSFWLATNNHSAAVIDIMSELNIAKYVTLGTFAKTFGFRQNQQY